MTFENVNTITNTVK